MRLELTQPDAPVRQLWSGWWALFKRVLVERALWLSLLVGLVALALAYQIPRSLFVDIGGPFDNAHTIGFYEPEVNAPGDANFRWSAQNSELLFQGIGKPLASFPVTLQLSSGRDAKSPPLSVNISVNGHPLPPLMLKPQSAPYVITVDPAWIDAS